MQSQERIPSNGRSKDPETSQIIADDDGNTSNEDSEDLRLARPNIFKPGVRREGCWSREDRNTWATQHGFYKEELPARSQPGSGRDGDEDEDGEQSDFCEDALDVNIKTGYMNAATSGGGEWTGKSEDACIARDEEWKEESPESWIQLPMLDTNVVDDDDVSAAMDESSGKACPSKQAPTGLSPFSRKSTDDEPSNGTFHYSSFFSSSQPTHLPLHLHTTLSSDLDPDLIIQDPTNSSSPIISTATLDALLDACIKKTRILLAAGREALGSKAGADFERQGVCASVDDDDDDDVDETGVGEVKGGDEEERSQSHSSAIGIAAPFTTTLDGKEEGAGGRTERKDHCSLAEKTEAATKLKKEIVRVENWYKIKGAGEAWREIGGCEDLMDLIVDVEVCV